MVAPWFKVDDVYITLGTTMKSASSRDMFRIDQYGPKLIARHAISGSKRLMAISSAGANANSRLFYLRVKATWKASSRFPLHARLKHDQVSARNYPLERHPATTSIALLPFSLRYTYGPVAASAIAADGHALSRDIGHTIITIKHHSSKRRFMTKKHCTRHNDQHSITKRMYILAVFEDDGEMDCLCHRAT